MMRWWLEQDLHEGGVVLKTNAVRLPLTDTPDIDRRHP